MGRPEIFIALPGLPIAVGLLLACIGWGIWMYLRPGPEREMRPLFGVAAIVVAGAALLELVAAYYPIWSGNGDLWIALSSSSLDEWLVRYFLLWVPVVLLVVSTLLITLSRSRRPGLLAWTFFMVPALIAVSYALLVMGVTISPS